MNARNFSGSWFIWVVAKPCNPWWVRSHLQHPRSEKWELLSCCSQSHLTFSVCLTCSTWALAYLENSFNASLRWGPFFFTTSWKMTSAYKAWMIPITNTCCTRHPLRLTVEGQEFLATVGKASVRVQPIPVEKKSNRTRWCKAESDNLFNSQREVKILIIFFEGNFLDLEVG